MASSIERIPDLTALDGASVELGDLFLINDMSEPSALMSKKITVSGMKLALSHLHISVTQAAHGFVLGSIVRFDGASWVESLADTAPHAIVAGIVAVVSSTSAFQVQVAGIVAGLTGLTAGTLYFLQDSGGLGASAGTVSVPVVLATSATTGIITR